MKIEWLDVASFEGLYVEDQRKDTLLYTKALKAHISGIGMDSRSLFLDDLILLQPHFELKKYKGSDELNLQFLIDYFKPAQPQEQSPFTLEGEGLLIRNGVFQYRDRNKKPDSASNKVDFQDLFLDRLNAEIKEVRFHGDSVLASVHDLGFVERNSGFRLDSLFLNGRYSSRNIIAQGLYLETRESKLKGEVNFRYKDESELREFVEKVRIDSEFLSSVVDLDDIAHFAPDLTGINRNVGFRGRLSGTVSDLRGKDLFLGISDDTFFKGDLDLTGLPDIDRTFISLQVDELRGDRKDLEQIPVPPFKKNKTLDVPPQLSNLGQFAFKGDFTGFINDFVAYGELNSSIGSVRSDLKLKRDTATGAFDYKGRLATYGFHIGEFYSIPELGRLSSKFEVEGAGISMEKLDAELKGNIRSLAVKGYTHKDIQVKGELAKDRFKGLLEGDDPNFDFRFNGTVDLSKEVPEYRFRMRIDTLRPVVLNLLERDSSALIHSTLVLDAQGGNIDELIGTVEAKNTIFQEKGKVHDLGNMSLESQRTGMNKKSLSFTSPFTDASVNGQFKFLEFTKSLLDQVYASLPAISNGKNLKVQAEQDFDIRLRIKDMDPIRGIFFPDLRIADNTVINGNYDSRSGKFDLVCFMPRLDYGGREFHEVEMNAFRSEGILNFQIKCEKASVSDSISMGNILFSSKAFNDNVQFSFNWKDGEPKSSGDIEGTLFISNKNRYELEFLSSQLSVKGGEWKIDPNAKVRKDSTAYKFSNFKISGKERFIEITGAISEKEYDELRMDFRNFEIGILSPFFPPNISLSGGLSGNATLSDVYQDPYFKSDINLDSLVLSGYLLGDLALKSSWNNEARIMDLTGSLMKNDQRILSLKGDYGLERQEKLDVGVDIAHLSIEPLNSFIEGGLDQIQGKISGDLTLGGTFKNPHLVGDAMTEDVSMRVKELNVAYGIDGQPITFYQEMIGFDYIPFHYFDQEGNMVQGQGRATGTLIHDHFTEWNFNIFLEFTNMLALNTTREMNDLYYGTAYGSGEVEIAGYPGTLSINVSAETEKNTDLKLPLSGSEDVTMENFVTFVQKEDTLKKEREKVDLEGIEMNFDLEVTPDAQVNIIFDEQIGDVMRGRGSGNIEMEVSSSGEFHMYGRYKVVEGNYLFTMQDVFNKRFIVKEGGVIQWYGDPYNAEIDLDAVYSLRTSVYPLMQGMENREAYRRRVPVDLVMHLSKNLMNPEINFNILFPTLDEDTRSIAMSRIESLNKQAFSLLVLKRFINEQNVGQPQAGGVGVSSTSSELLSNQLSNWLSSISKEFDLGVNYRPGDEITDEELAVALSTQLFNERLSISGNFGVSNASQYDEEQGNTNLVGDFTLQYDITPDGKFRLKVYNESNEDRISTVNQADYTQGVGVYYQEDFNSAKELVQEIRRILKRKDKEKEEEPPEKGKGRSEEENDQEE